MTPAPLRILVIISRPLGAEVSVEHEGRTLRGFVPIELPPIHIVRDGLRGVFEDDATPAHVRYLPWARLSDIQTAVAERYDVVHFVAHGMENGLLVLEGDDGLADLVEPKRAAAILADAGVRLALLSTCHSGRIGRALREAGIPNVIMVDEQFPMDARVAALFSRQFYARLTRGDMPSAAYRAGLTAVRSHALFGDAAPPAHNELTGEVEPRYGERFECVLDDDRSLCAETFDGEYKELYRSGAHLNVSHPEIVVGREVEMIGAIRLLRASRVATLTGPGGIGKTTVARAAALWHADRRIFRNGVIEVDAANVYDADNLARVFGEALDVTLDPHDAWKAIRDTLSGGRWLALRAPLNLVGLEQTYEIEQLPVGRHPGEVGDAERMFFAYTPHNRHGEIARGFVTVQAICRELDGYPLGILLEAAKLSDEKETPEGLLMALRANMIGALEYARAANLPERHKSVAAALKGSMDRLTAGARRLMTCIAVLPGGASEAILKGAEDSPAWRDGFDEFDRQLREHRLVSWDNNGRRYTLLPPIRAYALTLWASEAERDDYILRVVTALLPVAQMYDQLRMHEWPALDAEWDNLLWAMDWLSQRADKRPELMARYADALDQPLRLRFTPGRDHWLEAGLRGAQQIGDRWLEANVLQALGDLKVRVDDLDGARRDYETALPIYREIHDRLGEANTFLSMGRMALMTGDEGQGIEWLTYADRLYEKIHDQTGRANVGITLAQLAASKGEWQAAIEHMQPALDFVRRIQHPLADQLQAQIDEWRQRMGNGSTDAPGGTSADEAQAQHAFARFLDDVVAGARGDAQAGQRAYQFAQSLQRAAEAPAELRALDRACQRILEGLRGSEALEGLPEGIKPLVDELLKRVEGVNE
ncbi:MAG TPA: CHAT domain-containing protein [Anaerolineae bacterium]|nr:CHAT domain-containing protein [Anaerolineae bacterium]